MSHRGAVGHVPGRMWGLLDVSAPNGRHHMTALWSRRDGGRDDAIASNQSMADTNRAIIAVDLVQDFATGRGSRRVLNRISCRVGAGERMAILGRNGAGKSTLIKILA